MGKHAANQNSLRPAGDAVKAKIVRAGLKLGDLARVAEISQPTLTFYVQGRCRGHRAQVAIWEAFCRLAGQRMTMAEFWGDLLSERIAG